MSLTLWDIMGVAFKPRKKRPRRKPARSVPDHPPVPLDGDPRGLKPAARKKDDTVANGAKPGSMRARYDEVTKRMLAEHGVRVRKWRTSMSGVAWQVTYRDGTVSRLIESPRPRGPMSAAVFLHEIGHHAIGFGTYRPRCLEEYHAWKWSLEQMEAHGLNVTPAVRNRMRESLEYAVAKARRRGLKRLPGELAEYLGWASADRQGSERSARLGEPIAQP
ncbi:MAG: hypothetical protein RIB60_08415 [Phycisphaerales bacterium]